jgi:hypothetical protein
MFYPYIRLHFSNRGTFHFFLLCTISCGQKSQLQTECNQEIEKVKEKYELLRQEEDSVYHRLTTDLNRIYTKVLVNQSLAEFFKASLVQGIDYQYNFVFAFMY